MSLLAPIEDLIHKLDKEAAGELAAVKADVEAKFGQVLPVLVKLENTLKTAVTDAAEQASPGLKAAVEAAITAAQDELRSILGL